MRHDVDEYFSCSCLSDEHTVRFTYDTWDGEWPPELTLSVHLFQYKTFWQRLATAFWYVLGRRHRHRYGMWDTTMFEASDVSRLRTLLDKFERDCEEYRSKR